MCQLATGGFRSGRRLGQAAVAPKFKLESIIYYKGIISQFVLENLLSIRVFKSHGDILGYCCFAWNTLINHL